MKIITWNVNGIRACIKKGFWDWVYKEQPDILCIQETKIDLDQLTNELKNPESYIALWNSGERKGYSGVATFIKQKPLCYKYGFDIEKFDTEGRVIEIETEYFLLYNVYFPNGQKDEERLSYKLEFYKYFLDYTLKQKDKLKKDIIILGDFNTAHTALDLKNPKQNENYSGFLPIEREWIDKYIEAGYIDIFRKLHPDEKDLYTWWTYRFNAREKNIGWRIDYFMITNGLVPKVKETNILKNVEGSDHCPVSLTVDI